MIWVKPIHDLRNTESRLLTPGKFPPGIAAHLPSVENLKSRDRTRNTLYETPTTESQARCVRGWAPHIDTAFCISAFHISSFSVLDDWVEFFEKSVRKIIRSTDLLLVVAVQRARTEDLLFLTDLLDARARNGLPTMVDDGRGDRWVDVYEQVIEVG